MSDYDKNFLCEYSDFSYRDKSEPINNNIINCLINNCLKNSPYTKNELASRLDLLPEELENILKYSETLSVYDIVHISGALGYDFKFEFVKTKDC